MADKRCDNGHFIDESWDICPYCPQDLSEPEIAVVRPRAVEAPAPVAAPLPSPAAVAQAAPRTAGRESMSGSVSAVLPMERTVAASRVDAQKRYVVGWLVGINGASRGESFPVRMGRNVIGRDRKSDIVINDDQASSHHADLVFRPEEKRFILMDHNSTNGTYVNETEIEPRRDLAPKDVIRIGSQRFIFTPLCHDGFHWDDEGPLK
ncbi:MAG: hypothetical protein QOJ98_1133 [Acidobacteriota bacterium]|nr:hypothetical protein [Acidobacteriota bacterium]